jgi:HAD superfamily hydrolase (TIGR01549 family)
MTQSHTLSSLTEVIPLLDIKPTIRGVVFDLFGTLLQIKSPQRPYKQLLKSSKGVLSPHEFSISAMTSNQSLSEMTQSINKRLPVSQSINDEPLNLLLKKELDSIDMYQDVIPILHALRARNIPFVCLSNLASPYAAPAEKLLSPYSPKGILYSFSIGALKPDPHVFLLAADALSLPPASLLMIGDSFSSDVVGATRASYGHAAHLVRK